MFLRIINGRGYFHSIFILLLCFGILFLLTKGNKAVSFSFLIGTLFHLLLDLPKIPLFFPFISYDFKYIHDPIPYWIEAILTNPVVQITEIIGIVCLLFIVINNKLYSFKDIADYLRTNPKAIIYSIKKDTEIIISED